MSNPNISFRLSKYQLARGLWLIRKFEPTYRPTSLSKMVKLIYTDYLSKMNYGRSDVVPAEIVDEIRSMTHKGRHQQTSLSDFISSQEQPSVLETKVTPKPETSESKSTITTVTDFSPPADWLAEDDD